MDQATKDYLDNHDLVKTLQDLLNAVLREKPDDPLGRFATLMLHQNERGNDSTTQTKGAMGITPSVGERKGKWEVESSREIYQDHAVELREDVVIKEQEGKEGQCEREVRGIVTSKRWVVGCVPIFADGSVLLSGTYSYSGDVFSWEIPSLQFDHRDEEVTEGLSWNDIAEKQLERALVTCTGMKAGKFTPLCGSRSTNSDWLDLRMYLWTAEDLTPDLDATGVNRVTRKVPFKQVFSEISSGLIFDPLSQLSLYRAYHLTKSGEPGSVGGKRGQQQQQQQQQQNQLPPWVLPAPQERFLVPSPESLSRPIRVWSDWQFHFASNLQEELLGSPSETSGKKEKNEKAANATLEKHARELFLNDRENMMMTDLDDLYSPKVNPKEMASSLLAYCVLFGPLAFRLWEGTGKEFGIQAARHFISQRDLFTNLEQPSFKILALLPLKLSDSIEDHRNAHSTLDNLLKDSDLPPDSTKKWEWILKIFRDSIRAMEKFGHLPQLHSISGRTNSKAETDYLASEEGKRLNTAIFW